LLAQTLKKMKTKLLFTGMLLILGGISVFTQSIMWEKDYGGQQFDWGRDLLALENGNLMLLCTARSTTDDLVGSGNHDLGDFWVVETDADGNIIWNKCYGGTGIEHARSIILDNDGNYVITGYTESSDGDVVGHHGLNDVWVIKISPTGTLLNHKSFGGSDDDLVYDLIQTSDGGYAFVAGTQSNDGDVSGLHTDGGVPEMDFWVVKIDHDFNITWQKCYGGMKDEVAYDIVETPAGDFIVGGWTNSIDGDVTGWHPELEEEEEEEEYEGYDPYGDYWVIKINNTGDLLWQKCYGGGEHDFMQNILEDGYGNYMLVGYTSSHDGDVTNAYASGIWTLRINEAGEILNQYLYGQTGNYWMASARASDGGFLYTMESPASEGVAQCEFGVWDNYWIFKTDFKGRILWQTCVGGNSWDYPYAIEETPDGNFVVIGSIAEAGINISEMHGVKHDIWVVKIANDAPSNQININTFPAQALCPGSEITVPFAAYGVYNNTNVYSLEISDATGSFASPETVATIASKASGFHEFETILPGDIVPGGDYKLRVKSSNPPLIGTENQGDITTCPVPATLIDIVLSASSATISWADVNCAETFTVKYKKAIGGSWITVTSTDPVLTLTGLLPETEYKWKVRSDCNASPTDKSAFSLITESFTTLPLKEGDLVMNNFVITPNPTSDWLTIQMDYITSAYYQLFSTDGKLVLEGTINGSQNTIDVSSLNTGMYIVKLNTNLNTQSLNVIIE
jgi:hypothetical protein